MVDVAARIDAHHVVAAEDSELLAVLVSDARKEGGKLVVVSLAPFLERMVVALGTLHPRSEKDLRSGLGKVRRPAGNPVVVRRPGGERAALGGQKIVNQPVG